MKLKKLQRRLLLYIHQARLLIQMLNEDRCTSKAAALSYSSLLAFVPFSAFLFSLFTAFGVFSEELDTFRVFLIELLMPTKQEDLLGLFEGFISNSTRLGFSGLGIFAVTSVFLLDTITSSFNSLWGSKSGRSLTTKFTAYIALVVAGSLLISGAISLTGAIRRMLPAESAYQINLLLRLPIRLIPFVFTSLLLFMLYKLIPASYVQSRSALLGSIWGAALIEFSRFWFLKIANTFIRMSVVYGSLAAVPIFLFWLYVLWLLALLGLEIAYTHQFHIIHNNREQNPNTSIAAKLSIGLELFLTIARNYGGNLPDEKQLIKQFRISPEILNDYLQTFRRAGLLIETRPSSSFGTPSWVPGKPLAEITVNDILKQLISPSANSHPLLLRSLKGAQSALGDTSISEILASERKPPGKPELEAD